MRTLHVLAILTYFFQRLFKETFLKTGNGNTKPTTNMHEDDWSEVIIKQILHHSSNRNSPLVRNQFFLHSPQTPSDCGQESQPGGQAMHSLTFSCIREELMQLTTTPSECKQKSLRRRRGLALPSNQGGVHGFWQQLPWAAKRSCSRRDSERTATPFLHLHVCDFPENDYVNNHSQADFFPAFEPLRSSWYRKKLEPHRGKSEETSREACEKGIKVLNMKVCETIH
jgi:hypothetical protein